MHAFTVCDTASSLGGKARRPLGSGESLTEATHAFEELLLMQRDISNQTMSVLEQFVVFLYDQTSSIMEVNAAWKELFTKKSRSLENIPPTQAALKQHNEPVTDSINGTLP